MLITRENILDRFTENLEWTIRIDLATAWVTRNEGLRALEDRTPALEIRAIVGGLRDNITEPKALHKLAKAGELRRFPAAGESPRFHPKVYIFRGADESVAWIGSANFTGRGFGSNEEVLFETSDTEAVESWFDQLWERCYPLNDWVIGDYDLSRTNWRKKYPPQPLSAWTPVTIDLPPPIRLMDGVDDWSSYIAALERCNRWWKWWTDRHAKFQWSVLGDECSWRNTIRVLHEVIQRDWRDELSDDDRSHLRGVGGTQWALLGDLKRIPETYLFGKNRKKIQEVLRDIAVDDTISLDEAIEVYELLVGFTGIGRAAATRLLTLAKPDRFISLNGGSEEGLEQLFGPTPRSIKKSQKYRFLLEKIYSQRWFREPAPQDKKRRDIWRMRTALLDCFVYDDSQNKKRAAST